MKILQITSTFFPVIGGQEKVVYEISKRLVKGGHKVTILTTDLFCKRRLPKKEKIDGINIVRYKNNFFLGGYGFSFEALRWLRKNWKNYDVIHSHGYNRFLSEFSVSYLKNKIPTVFTSHGFIHTKKNYLFKIAHDLTLGKMIKYAGICTALTRLDFQNYSNLGVERKKILELPNGVDIENFKKVKKKEIDSFKKKYNLKNTILFVGRIYKSKGLQHLVRTIKDLNCKLLIVGKDVEYKQKLLKIIKNLGISNKVTFTDFLKEKDLIIAYHACDILVLFSEWEGFGIVVIEAMAAGKPVIVSDRGALPYLVKNRKNGFVVPYGNIKKLREKIEFLLKNKKIAQKIGNEGKKTASKFSWDSVVNKLIKIYNRLV